VLCLFQVQIDADVFIGRMGFGIEVASAGQAADGAGRREDLLNFQVGATRQPFDESACAVAFFVFVGEVGKFIHQLAVTG